MWSTCVSVCMWECVCVLESFHFRAGCSNIFGSDDFHKSSIIFVHRFSLMASKLHLLRGTKIHNTHWEGILISHLIDGVHACVCVSRLALLLRDCINLLSPCFLPCPQLELLRPRLLHMYAYWNSYSMKNNNGKVGMGLAQREQRRCCAFPHNQMS